MITEDLRTKVLDQLRNSDLAKGRWGAVDAEIQGDFEYLLVSLESPFFGDDAVDIEVKRDVGDLLVSMLPSGGDDVLGRWMVVFKKSGKVVDSWAPYDL